MSQARPVFKNASMMLTRGVHGRRFSLRPCAKTDQVCRYVVAVMAEKWKIDLHALTFLSNHHHECVTDVFQNIVDFQRDCHSFISRALNVMYDDEDSMWSSDDPSRVEATLPSDLIEQIAYTMANPVEAGLVRHGKSWPGIRHAWPQKPIIIKRPTVFFRGEENGGVWPKTATLTFSRPPGFEESDEDLSVRVATAINDRELKFQKEFDETGRRFLGRRAVLDQSRYATPSTPRKKFQISPQIACKDKGLRQERIAERKLWRCEYKTVQRAWAQGNREVVFPYGTYKMRVVHGATCALEPG